MPQEVKSATPTAEPRSIEGIRLEPDTQASQAEAVRLAFDYRGDVTVYFHQGDPVTGFVCNRNDHSRQLEIISKGQDDPQTIPYHRIRAIEFSGEDKAFGKSWDDWQRKSSALRHAEAERLEIEARHRGEL
jgi:hypothetical protein